MPRLRISVHGEIELHTKDARAVAHAIGKIECAFTYLENEVSLLGGTVVPKVELLTGRSKARPGEPEFPLDKRGAETALDKVERTIAGDPPPASDAEALREIGDRVKAALGEVPHRETVRAVRMSEAMEGATNG